VEGDLKALSYNCTGLSAGGRCYFRLVSSVNSEGESVNSTEVWVGALGGNATNQRTFRDSMCHSLTTDRLFCSRMFRPCASGYTVKRALNSGGPYTTVASSVAPAFTDNDLTNGTAYYYVVSAKNAAGGSSRFFQVSATPRVRAAGITLEGSR